MKDYRKRTLNGKPIYLPKVTVDIARQIEREKIELSKIIVVELKTYTSNKTNNGMTGIFSFTYSVVVDWKKNISQKNLQWLTDNGIAFYNKNKALAYNFMSL